MRKRHQKRYDKFVEKNKEVYDMHMAIYKNVYIIYIPWTIRNIYLWLIQKKQKPGFSFINPENNEYENLINNFKNKKNGRS